MLDFLTSDKDVDVVETGTGFTPIIGLDYVLSDKMNIALKYEFKTKLELSTEIIDNKDGSGMYTEGEKNRADMPAQLTAGLTMKPSEKILASAGFHMYFDKNADYGKTTTNTQGDVIALENKDILNNTMEIALGAQYNLTEKLMVSAGWLHVISGATEDYQSDIDFDLNSNTFGGGFGFALNPKIELNLAGSYTKYIDGEKNYNAMLGTNPIPTIEKYSKNTWIVAVGININLGAVK
jgi:long-chain fatty acid transport protein